MLDEMKKDLEKEFSKICDYSDDCENKQKALQANTNDSKLTKMGIIGMFSIIPTIIAGAGIIAPITTGLALPLTASMGMVMASSLAIGYVGQSIITSISKKKMKKFTDVKTNGDILEEMIHYELEIDKAENKKETLRKMYKNIESKQQILSDYSSEFYQIDKYAKLTPEDLKKRQEMLIKAYDERMEQLDVLTSQAYLKNKFRSRRKKRERIENIIAYSLMMSLPFCLIIGMPLSLELMRDVTMETFADFGKYIAMCFSPTLVVAPISLPYFIKRNKDFNNAFNNLNQSLGENALSEKPNAEYEDELDYMISKKIGELVELGMEIKETKHTLERAITDQTKKEDNRTTLQVISNGMDKLGKIQIDGSQELFNPQPQDDRSPLKVAKAGLRKVGEINIEPPKDTVDISWVKPYLAEDIETDEVINSQEQAGPVLVKRRTPPKHK